MAPMAIALGLQPLDPGEAARVPKRALVDDVLVDGVLPDRHVYMSALVITDIAFVVQSGPPL